MSIISGFPSSAKMAIDMYEQGNIDECNVQKIIMFSHFANPLFIINMVDNKKMLILLSHFISNFLIALITRKKYVSINSKTISSRKKYSLSEILFSSINSATSTLMFILGTVTTFYVVAELINIPFLSIILELTHGLSYLAKLNLSLKMKAILTGGLLSFGGLCIHFQVYGILSNIKIKYLPYFISRLLHSLLTMIIIFIFYEF